MKYDRFEQLPVWQAAIELGTRVDATLGNEHFRGRGSLRDQVERAAVPISNNIAEGFERGTTEELLTFIYYAKGSAGEARSMPHLLLRRTERKATPITPDTSGRASQHPSPRNSSQISNFRSEISNLKSEISNRVSSQTPVSDNDSEPSGLSSLCTEFSALVRLSESISRQLSARATHLQTPPIEGPRRLNDAAREQLDRAKRREAFLKKLEETKPRFGDPE